jgi:hypothetical protein
MTSLMRRTEPWSVHPGWGIFVDLTPPELLTSRRIRLLRKGIVSALAVVVVLCAGGYVLAARQRSTTETGLANAQLQTTQLQTQAHRYDDVTQIQGTVKQVQAQIADALHGDVAVDQLIARIRGALPKNMTIRQVAVSLSLAGVNDGTGTAATGTIDQNGHSRIGTITLSGDSSAIDDLSAFVDRIGAIRGAVDVVPTSNTRSDQGVQYTLSLGFDDQLLTHEFDAKGGK